MTYIITEPCVNVKDAACIDVCPVDCIHPRKAEPDFKIAPQLYIDSQECIDCGACEPECPVNAIYLEDDLPVEWERYERVNFAYFQAYQLFTCLRCQEKVTNSMRFCIYCGQALH